jgi:hypothetical protein
MTFNIERSLRLGLFLQCTIGIGLPGLGDKVDWCPRRTFPTLDDASVE